MATLTRLGFPGDERAWATLGFLPRDGAVRIGRIPCTLGIGAGWGFDDAESAAQLGVPEVLGGTVAESAGRTADPAAHHPNGATFVDHVVYWVPDLNEAVATLNTLLGTEPRRRFRPRGPDGPEMAFYRVGEAFIEVVATGHGAPALIGIAFGTADLDATVAAVRAAGGPIGDPKPAVQGGRIASVWHGHVDWGIAFLEPAPRSTEPRRAVTPADTR